MSSTGRGANSLRLSLANSLQLSFPPLSVYVYLIVASCDQFFRQT